MIERHVSFDCGLFSDLCSQCAHGRELSLDITKLIISLHEKKQGSQKIATTLSFNKNTVAKVVQHYQKYGRIKQVNNHVVKMANVDRSKEGEVEEIWQELKENLRKASDDVLGRTNPGRKEQRESWWWNEDVRQVLEQKKLVFKKW